MWLQLDLQQIQDFLLILLGLSHLLELHVIGADPLAADALESRDHIFNRPLPVLTLPVLLEERLQALLQVPLQVIGQHAQPYVA